MLQHFGPAWASAPAQVTDDTAELQITEQGAGAHVGGKGTRRSEAVTGIKPRGSPGAVQSAIARATGGGIVSLSRLTTTGVRLPGRPHANPNNPVTAGKIERRVLLRRFEGA